MRNGNARAQDRLVVLNSVARSVIEDPRFVAIRDGLMNAGASYRSFGAAALQLAHVAAGQLDAYIQCELAAWDAMAGLLLVEEAGGYAAEFPGPSGLTEKAPLVATAPGIAAEVSAIIAIAG